MADIPALNYGDLTWQNATEYPTLVETEGAVRTMMQKQPDFIKNYINNTLVNDINTDIKPTLAGKQNQLTFDDAPTNGSNNPVKSGGIYTALAGKQNTLTFDSTPTEDSTNPVTSGGIYNALGTIAGALTLEFGSYVGSGGSSVSAYGTGTVDIPIVFTRKPVFLYVYGRNNASASGNAGMGYYPPMTFNSASSPDTSRGLINLLFFGDLPTTEPTGSYSSLDSNYPTISLGRTDIVTTNYSYYSRAFWKPGTNKLAVKAWNQASSASGALLAENCLNSSTSRYFYVAGYTPSAE